LLGAIFIPLALMLVGFLWWPSWPSHWTALSPLHWLLLGTLFVVLDGLGGIAMSPLYRRLRRRRPAVILDERWLAQKQRERSR
jgi:hypothetical protein